MTTLGEAWAWYRATKVGAERLARLAKYWDGLPWDDGPPAVNRIGRDNILGHVDSMTLAGDATASEVGLADLAVLVLFSVFEAQVRDWVKAGMRPELEQLRDPTLRKAGQDSIRTVEDGSFGRVLEPYKSPAGPDLVEEVNQVRKYRNWVAHGRRPDGRPEVEIDPRAAYDRLTRFLAALRGTGSPP
ncbi:MAG TPA: hypothetical protein VH092_19695 [Urbifossiella sp.]|nr:hypothetical protein [Urbifossiella sp.]